MQGFRDVENGRGGLGYGLWGHLNKGTKRGTAGRWMQSSILQDEYERRRKSPRRCDTASSSVRHAQRHDASNQASHVGPLSAALDVP